MEKTYVTRYKGLELVYTPMGTKDAQGNKIPAIKCFFIPTSYGYAYTTKDEKIAAWLDKHEYMLRGKIQHFDKELCSAVEPVEVSRKGVTSAPTITPTVEAPVENPKKPHTVKIRK